MNGDIIVIILNTGNHVKLRGHNDDICTLSFNWSTGQYADPLLVSTSRDSFISIWDPMTRRLIADYKLESSNKQKQKNWFSACFIPQKNQSMQKCDKFEVLAGTGDGDVIVFEVPSNPPNSKVRIYRPPLFDSSKKHSHSSVIFNFTVDPKNMLATTLSLDHQIIVWDLNQRIASSTFYTFMHGAHGITFSPIEPSLFAVASGDGIRVIKLTKDIQIASFTSVPIQLRNKDSRISDLAWHPEIENRLAYSRTDGFVSVIDVNTKQGSINIKYSTKFIQDKSKIYTIIWGPGLMSLDQWAVYTVHQSGHIYLHYPTTNTTINFDKIASDVYQKKRSEIRWKTDYTLLAVGNEDGSIDIFERRDNEIKLILLIKGSSKCVLCLRWNPHLDLYPNCLAVSTTDNEVRIFFLSRYIDSVHQNPTELPKIKNPDLILVGHKQKVTYLSWSPFDGNKLASSSYDQTVQIWSLIDGVPIVNYRGHRGVLYFVEWCSHDSDLVVSGGEDNILNIWRPSKQSDTCPPSDLNKNHKVDNSFECRNFNDDSFSNDIIVKQVLNGLINKVVKLCDKENSSFTKIKSNDLCNGHGNELVSDVKSVQTKSNSISKSKKKEKRVSLFPLFNLIDSSSSKIQKLQDIEILKNKMLGKEVPGDKSERISFYGDDIDISKMLDRESDYHEKQGNFVQKNILGFFQDVNLTVKKAISSKQLNGDIVAMAMSVSRKLWLEACEAYIKQLESSGEIEMCASYMLGLNRVKEAIDILRNHNYYREAIVIAKLKQSNEQLINELVTAWANLRESNGDYEGAAKCYVSLGRFDEANAVLTKRSDGSTLLTASNLNY